MTCNATAGGITKIPTSRSATAKFITKQFVTVRSLRVVKTDSITSIFPITVTKIRSTKIDTAINLDQPIVFR